MNILTFFQAEPSGLIQVELIFVILLSIAALVAIAIRYIKVPYTVALVVVGLALAFVPNVPEINLSSDLILAILVPPLLFEATLHISWSQLKNELVPVLLLALVGTLLGTAMVGFTVFQFFEIPVMAAIAFGALISATDPVAVISFFRTLGVSKRLSMLVEGESLFNDGVAIVIFNLALAAAVAGTGLHFNEALIEFVREFFGGLLVGLLLGFFVSYIILKNLDDHLIETTTTVALAFGAYVVATELHVSGILAVIAAGLMVGNLGSRNISPTTKLTLENFWEFMAFVVNSLIFLLLGLQIQIDRLIPSIVPIFVAILAILGSRAVIVYSLTWIYEYFTPRLRIPRSYRHVMYWGGLRGAISLALALTLTEEIFSREVVEQLRVMTFGVVLFTLLVQGMTIEKLIVKLGLSRKPDQLLEQQRQQALLYVKQAGQRELLRLRDDGILFPDIWEAMNSVYDEEIQQYETALGSHLASYPELEQEMLLQAREDVLKAERTALADARMQGFIDEEVHDDLVREAANRIAAIDLIRAQRGVGSHLIATDANSETEPNGGENE